MRRSAPTRCRSIEFSGSGRWFQFGQAPSPTLPWPQFDVSSYTATINYETPAARVQMTRIQTIEPGRARPAPVEQRPDQYVQRNIGLEHCDSRRWLRPRRKPQPAAVEERTMEIWTTPHGFLSRPQLANNATVARRPASGSEVAFTVGGKHRYVGTINAQNQVDRVQTWIDNPILGDTAGGVLLLRLPRLGGVMFPGRIVRTQGGHPVLDLTIAAVKANPAVDIAVPAEVSSATPGARGCDSRTDRAGRVSTSKADPTTVSRSTSRITSSSLKDR